MNPHELHRLFGGQLRARPIVHVKPAITVYTPRRGRLSRLLRRFVQRFLP